MLMKRFLTLAAILIFAFSGTASAQKCAVKTNALYWTTATPNVGVEFALANRWTVDLSGGYNPWTLSSKENFKLKHFQISPEIRYWFCESFQGHFIGINGVYTQFNVGAIPYILKDARKQGWAAGAGLTFGYAVPIARRWNLELTAGAGCWFTKHDEFESRKCGLFQQRIENFKVGPTSLGITFVYMIK
jgi:hypothetical protein